jgi:hypothetical protein
LIFLIIPLFFCACGGDSGSSENKNDSVNVVSDAKVQIYYFHGERRCPSCIAIEDETRKLLDSAYSGAGIAFSDINVDEEKNAALAEKYQVAGSALIVVKNGTPEEFTDITGDGFKFALRKPAEFHIKLKEVLDTYLK